MYSDRQILFDDLTTTRAHLRCIGRIDQNDPSTSIFRFVRSVLYQFVPCRIQDTLRKVVIMDHVGYIQIFKYYYSVFIDPFSTQLLGEIFSSIGYSLI